MTSYLEGLYWILTYYHKGCQSWNWFYPYLYAPLASDLINLASINVTFSKGKPFTPLLQLLSVLPPQSGNSFFNCYFIIMIIITVYCIYYYTYIYYTHVNIIYIHTLYIYIHTYIYIHILLTYTHYTYHTHTLTYLHTITTRLFPSPLL